jgi:hypothetical protein
VHYRIVSKFSLTKASLDENTTEEIHLENLLNQAWWHKSVFPALWKAEAGGSQIQSQPGLYSKTLSPTHPLSPGPKKQTNKPDPLHNRPNFLPWTPSNS